MNRRNFINNLLVAGASFTILPGAGRLWMAQRAAFEMCEHELALVPCIPDHPMLMSEFIDALYEHFSRRNGWNRSVIRELQQDLPPYKREDLLKTGPAWTL